MATIPEEVEIRAPAEPPGLLRKLLAVRHSWVAKVGSGLVLFWIGVALIAPFTAPYDPNAQDFLALANPYPGGAHLLGTDMLGRDLLSRVMWGARTVLAGAPLAVLIAYLLGCTMGLLAGYHGGWVDTVVQRLIDLLISIPTIPLWMALAASIPPTLPPIETYALIVVILSVTDWTTLARVVRGQFLSLREEDYVLAARLAGVKPMKIIFRHMVPAFASYVIVYMTLAIPNMILGETALSFLGLGLQAPAVSWGVMLSEAQQVLHIAQHPWVLLPAVFVVVVVLMFNFLGDGLRDAADPYK